jgi:hypothetical protein
MWNVQLDPKMYPPLEPKYDENGLMIFPEPEPLTIFGEVSGKSWT